MGTNKGRCLVQTAARVIILVGILIFFFAVHRNGQNEEPTTPPPPKAPGSPSPSASPTTGRDPRDEYAIVEVQPGELYLLKAWPHDGTRASNVDLLAVGLRQIAKMWRIKDVVPIESFAMTNTSTTGGFVVFVEAKPTPTK